MEALTLTLTLLVGAAVALGWRAAHLARFTSLVAATRWETLSLMAIGAVECFVGRQPDDVDAAWVAPLRWVAASMVFCGWMARLGARRPHGAGWQFVVATLWGVLALPAAEVFFLQSGQAFEIHAARGFFLWLLIAGGLANSLPTRLWPSGLLDAVGQIILLAAHLPGLRIDPTAAQATRGVHTVALAMLVAAHAWRARPGPAADARPGLTGVWLDFRDQFGAWWGLRLAERVNATAAQARWPLHLTWSGFVASEESPGAESPGLGSANVEIGEAAPREDGMAVEDLEPQVLTAVRQTMWNMLRRFVSPHWIAGRLGDVSDDA